MNSIFWVSVGLILVFALNLLTIVARSALRQAILARLLQFKDSMGAKVERSLNVINLMPRPYAGLNLWQSIFRFLFAGLLFLVIYWGDSGIQLPIVLGILILAAVVIASVEWVIERRVANDPELWVIRLTLYIQVLSWIIYPLVVVNLWLSKDTSLDHDASNTVTEDEL